ncbi:MAG TPA: rhomboid family intramembrane serine protease [Ilumatobacteraceae bacterium]|nr:rhomboid family intramembrane serine protease [Ilumatobacteraceae bacterium]
MAGRFAYSKPHRRGPNDPWFRVGTLDIGSAALLALMCIVSVFIYAIEPVDKPILFRLALIAGKVTSGQVWRVFTWPLANGLDQQILWVLISIAVLWYFGSRLEEQVGRTRMAWYLVMIIVIPGLVGTALDLPQAGIHTVQLVVLLTYVAEYPNVRFFFGIPAWVLGAVYVAAEVLQLAGDRAGRRLLFFIVSLLVGALAGRAVGMLEAFPWIPKIGVPHRHRQPKRSRRPAVVTGPWGGPSSVSADQSELDDLLDKISAKGMDSLSKSEKQRLNELSKRLRGS